jgi:hypothetical protein
VTAADGPVPTMQTEPSIRTQEAHKLLTPYRLNNLIIQTFVLCQPINQWRFMWGNLEIWKRKRHSFLDKEQTFALQMPLYIILWSGKQN